MRRIPLRTVEASDGSAVIDYADAIRQVIRQPLDQQRGVGIEEMRRGIRILDALDAPYGNDLNLEDADWDHLAAKVRAMQWGMVDRHLLEFIDAVLDAPDVTANGQVTP